MARAYDIGSSRVVVHRTARMSTRRAIHIKRTRTRPDDDDPIDHQVAIHRVEYGIGGLREVQRKVNIYGRRAVLLAAPCEQAGRYYGQATEREGPLQKIFPFHSTFSGF